MTYNADRYINLIRSRLSDYRFHHSMCVADSAKQLAARFGEDESKAYLAGILHDVMKEAPESEQLEACEKAGFKMTQLELSNKKLYHQMSGAAFIKTELGITDCDLINAVRYHTTGRANMSLLEQILYIADFISADRDYDDVDKMREKADEGLKEAMVYAMRYTIVENVNKLKTIHPDTINAYNWVVSGSFAEEKNERTC